MDPLAVAKDTENINISCKQKKAYIDKNLQR